jgi:trans-aconitate methyltransferase
MLNQTRFSNRADNYKKFRPSYPQDVLEPLKKVGLTSASIVADVGSGTGIFTQILLSCGAKVFGVEPNKAMRDSAEEKLSGEQNFVSVDGSAENTTLAE